jgi:large subunit ribosomal protein L3
MKFILGQKKEMSQIFDDKGNQIPVTLITAGPCQVLQIKTKEKDGYDAVQIGFSKLTKKKKIKKTMKGKEFRWLREFPLHKEGKDSSFKVGDQIDVSVFEPGDKVAVSGISKGKGFAGAVKRWGFAGMPASRGSKHEIRTIGSIGGSIPPRVIKGKKMPGRMGTDRVTVKNLKVVKVDPKNNLIALKGAVPGSRGTFLEIRSLKEKSKE